MLMSLFNLLKEERMKLAKLAVFSLLSMSALTASASIHSLSFVGGHDLSSTNWNDVFSLQRFDANLGTLTGVNVDLYGTVKGSAKYESLDASASNVQIDLGAIIKLATVSGKNLLTINPLVSNAYSASAYDGITDFGGTSGKTLTGLSANAADSEVLNSASWLSLFTGPGMINLKLAAQAASSASGPGNLTTQFATNAAANYKITYTYAVTPVPEPETYALMGLGMLALLVHRRKQVK
ncbi:choice-of-anchor E domain-containing protein [Iodobacter sp. CM08]|uniref:choice-of-anchor E domain-containing protein n=1 Tax=Iodobacter sp. CM08 TaxID=3085902 RepID=UPI002981D6B8|nr:choice-of-anchor E domain-containing protein [Iodobacter sp. CM08]MDW5417292.1 choice-of-anchor E domain-containing protein [Iodobacter sp. CM08]